MPKHILLYISIFDLIKVFSKKYSHLRNLDDKKNFILLFFQYNFVIFILNIIL